MNSSDRRLKLANLFFIIFSVVGLGVMLWSSWHWFQLKSGQQLGPSFCNINEYWNCDRVSLSRYGSILSVPIGIFGAIFFGVGLLASLTSGMRRLWLVLWHVPAVLVSLFLSYVLFFELRAGCLICVFGYLCVLGSLGAAFLWSPGWAISRGNAVSLGVVAAIVLGLFVWGQWPQETSRHDAHELERFKAWFRTLAREPMPEPSAFVKGAASPRVQVYEFSDFACPHCQRAALQLVPQLLLDPEVQIVFFPVPLDGACHPDIPVQRGTRTCDWSKLALCAEAQGRFWTFHDRLFAAALRDGGLPNVNRQSIEQMGLHYASATQCLESDETELALQELIEVSRSLKIRSTPSFFVNGRRIEGALEASLFRILIEEAKRDAP